MNRSPLYNRWQRLPEAVRYSLWLYFITRTIYSLLALLVLSAVPLSPKYPQAPVHTWLEQILIAPWYRWDVEWFLRIVQDGYTVVDGRSSFFPLYPLLVRLIGDLLGGNYLWSGLIVSNLALIAALILLFNLVEARYGRRAAKGTLICLALYPTYFFNFAYYAESLTLLFTVGTFYAMDKQRWPLAGLCASLAVLAKLPAVVLLAPLIWEFGRQRRALFSRDSLAIIAIPITLGTWSIWVRYMGTEAAITDFSSPFGVLTPLLTPSWQTQFKTSIVWPWQAIVLGVQSINVALELKTVPGLFKVVYDLLMVAFFALTIPLILRLKDSTYLVYAVASFIMNLMVVIASTPIANFPRRMMMVFPLFIVLGMVSREQRLLRLMLLPAALLLSFMVSTFFFLWRWVG